MKDWYQLKPDVQARLAARDQTFDFPERKRFLNWAKKNALPGEPRSFEHRWSEMASGKTVYGYFARLLIRYEIESRKLKNVSIDTYFNSTLEEPEEGIYEKDTSGVLYAINSIMTTIRSFAKEHRGQDIVNTRPELEKISRRIALQIGTKQSQADDAMDEISRIERGTDTLQSGIPEFAGLLSRWIGNDRRTRIVTSVVHEGRVLGNTVVLPLRLEALIDLCQGRKHHSEITPDDLDKRSGHLFVFIGCDPVDTTGIDAVKKSLAHARALYLQATYFTRGMRPLCPLIVIVASHPDYVKRCQRMGYIPTGATEKGTNYPVMVIGTSKLVRALGLRSTRMSQSQYIVHHCIMKIFRTWNRKKWIAEDAGD